MNSKIPRSTWLPFACGAALSLCLVCLCPKVCERRDITAEWHPSKEGGRVVGICGTARQMGVALAQLLPRRTWQAATERLLALGFDVQVFADNDCAVYARRTEPEIGRDGFPSISEAMIMRRRSENQGSSHVVHTLFGSHWRIDRPPKEFLAELEPWIGERPLCDFLRSCLVATPDETEFAESPWLLSVVYGVFPHHGEQACPFAFRMSAWTDEGKCVSALVVDGGGLGLDREGRLVNNWTGFENVHVREIDPQWWSDELRQRGRLGQIVSAFTVRGHGGVP